MEKILLIAAGAIGLYLSGRLLVDAEYAKKYVAESPKAYLLRKAFGIDRALQLTKYFFAPLGIALSLTVIALGLIK